MNKHDLISLYVAFNKTNTGKRRSVLVVHYDGDGIEFYRLTSKYENKSDTIQAQYYEMKDWEKVGLAKKSWIDIGKRLWLPMDDIVRVIKIGKLTLKDKKMLASFIEDYYS